MKTLARACTLAALPILALAGCSSSEGDAPTDDATANVVSETPVASTSAGETPAPRPTMRSPVDGPGPITPLPPAGSAHRYVGRWAASAHLCDAGAWVFTPDHLATSGGVSCDFTEVTKTPGGYDIAAHCTADAPAQDDTIKLRFAESAQAMLVEGSKTFTDTGLIYCGAE